MGTRKSRYVPPDEMEDHPHAYGDKNTCFIVFALQAGSSPRVWGQGRVIVIWIGIVRIIPTRMGTRKKDGRDIVYNKDHPHAYGDKLITV